MFLGFVYLIIFKQLGGLFIGGGPIEGLAIYARESNDARRRSPTQLASWHTSSLSIFYSENISTWRPYISGHCSCCRIGQPT